MENSFILYADQYCNVFLYYTSGRNGWQGGGCEKRVPQNHQIRWLSGTPALVLLTKNPAFSRFKKICWILAYFNNGSCFHEFKLFLLLQTGDFLSVLFVFFHAVYWCYILSRANEFLVSPLFSHEAKIFGIHSHFSEHQMHLLLEWIGSSDIWSLSHQTFC